MYRYHCALTTRIYDSLPFVHELNNFRAGAQKSSSHCYKYMKSIYSFNTKGSCLYMVPFSQQDPEPSCDMQQGLNKTILFLVFCHYLYLLRDLMVEKFNLTYTTLVLEDMDGHMDIYSAGRSACNAFDLFLLCINSYNSASMGEVNMM